MKFDTKTIEKDFNEYKRKNNKFVVNLSRFLMFDSDLDKFILLNKLNENDINKVDQKFWLFDESKYYKHADKIPNKKMLEFIDNFNIYDCISQRYINLIDKNNIYDSYYIHNSKTYSEKEIKDIMLSFFSSYGNSEYNVVKKIFDEGRISDSDFNNEEEAIFETYGICTPIVSISKSYVNLYLKKNNLKKMAVLAHELGHAIEAYNNNGRYNEYTRFGHESFLETVSSYFELEFLKYARDNYIDRKDALAQLVNYYNSCKSFLNDFQISTKPDLIVCEDRLYEKTDEISFNNGTFYNLANVYDENLNFLHEANLANNILEDLSYGLGKYNSIKMYKLRSENKNEFRKNFYKFLSTNTICSYKDAIKNLGMRMDEYLSIKDIEEEIKKDNEEFKKAYKLKY